jgi:predicted ribosome quality control (RQC) complex YloA/Tae2 family protein
MKDFTFESKDIQYSIKVGENAQENWDLIDSSSQNDLWFHVKSHPSCHVVLSMGDINIKKIDQQVIKYCASLCKDGSKLKNYQNIKIMYTYIKNVKKSTDVGSVTTTNSKTISI